MRTKQDPTLSDALDELVSDTLSPSRISVESENHNVGKHYHDWHDPNTPFPVSPQPNNVNRLVNENKHKESDPFSHTRSSRSVLIRRTPVNKFGTISPRKLISNSNWRQRISESPNIKAEVSIPKELKALLGLSQSLETVLSVIGLKRDQSCFVEEQENLAQLRECILDAFIDLSSAFDALYESASLNQRVLSGGRTAAKALARLRSIFAYPYGPSSLRATGTPLTCLILSGKESTPDYLRWQALSIVTLLTGVPTGTSIDDTATGGFGHINLVMPNPSRVYNPDHMIQMLQSGINPAATPLGNLYENEVYDNINSA